MLKNKGFIFTNKAHSQKGIMSAVLGMISLFSVFLTIYYTAKAGGRAPLKYGFSVLLAMLYAIAGLVLGIRGRMEKDKFYLFAYMGIVLNGLMVVGIVLLLFVGVYGI